MNIEKFVFYGETAIQAVELIDVFSKQVNTLTFRSEITREIAVALALHC